MSGALLVRGRSWQLAAGAASGATRRAPLAHATGRRLALACCARGPPLNGRACNEVAPVGRAAI